MPVLMRNSKYRMLEHGVPSGTWLRVSKSKEKLEECVPRMSMLFFLNDDEHCILDDLIMLDMKCKIIS